MYSTPTPTHITFLLQTKNGKPIFDFQYALIEAINQREWLDNTGGSILKLIRTAEAGFRIIDSSPEAQVLGISEAARRHIPVGSVSFVEAFLERYFNTSITAYNVPEFLVAKEFTQRRYYKELSVSFTMIALYANPHTRFLIKDALHVKGYCDIHRYDDGLAGLREQLAVDEESSYDVSEWLSGEREIKGEFRVFVEDNRILGVRQYVGEWDAYRLLDDNFIRKVVKTIGNHTVSNRLPCYTVDIAVLANETNAVMEMHPFISCGLYGFETVRLPKMVRDAYLAQAQWQTALVEGNE